MTRESEARSACDSSPVKCPVCKGVASQLLGVSNGYHVWQCRGCDLDFVHPMPASELLEAYYSGQAYFEGGEPGGYVDYDDQSAHLLDFAKRILDAPGCTGNGRSILDVGCAYGSLLAVAHERGWDCFGLEISEYARRVIRQRHGRKFHVVDRIEHVVPREFSLIVMADVLEHFPDPYSVFYTLFSKGCITPETRVVISTPNARSAAAMADPMGWEHRHPPSHLLFFSAESLVRLLKRLRFHDVYIWRQNGEKTSMPVYPSGNLLTRAQNRAEYSDCPLRCTDRKSVV